MLATDIGIINAALTLTGNRQIGSLEEQTGEANICATLYPAVKRACLSAHPWRFTIDTRQLNRLTATVPGWACAFQMPANLIQLRQVFPGRGQATTAAYEIQGDRLLTDHPRIRAEFSEITSESRFPPWFVTLLETALAARLAMAIAEDSGKAQWLEQMAWGSPSEGRRGGLMRQALTADSQQSPVPALRDMTFVAARFGGAG